MSKEIYEKLGLFYLGKDVDKTTLETTEALTLLKNKDFTTHAAIIGMTGSGKTGLGISLIEEAIIDNIPSIVIDPKGDMGNLLLTDPKFEPSSFEPWVKDEAVAKGENSSEYAAKVALEWREGLESWDQGVERVENFHSYKKTIYTPGSSSGVPINILASLERPSSDIIDDSDTLTTFLKSTVASLLSLIDIDADPINSKEFVVLSKIILDNWQQELDISIEQLIGSLINPPFKKIGVLELESYYPQSERLKLATKFNALLASPSFSSWLQGENLDIQKLLYDENGKAKIAIFSIAHLSDSERMFFVTLLLNKYIAWMRRQSGTTALKTVLYMDEIFGFFPPSKNPPSKEPMLLLLKQARAFGVGVILSTQNPVDLDYKGLSNIGTWFIGRLQTSQDIERIINGLEGKAGDTLSKNEIQNILASLKKRTFLLKSAHRDAIEIFETRWVLSYLKGPLNKDEISTLMQAQKTKTTPPIINRITENTYEEYENFNTIDNSIVQYYEIHTQEEKYYQPTLTAKVEIGFYSQTKAIDEKITQTLSLMLNEEDNIINWLEATEDEESFDRFPTQKPLNAKLKKLPSIVQNDKGLSNAKKSLENTLYSDKKLELYRSKSPKLESKPNESLGDFKVRLQDILDQQKEEEIEKLKSRYASKEQILQDRVLRAHQRVQKEQSDMNSKTTDTVITAGIAILGAFFGKKSTTQIGTTLAKGSQILKEQSDVKRAEQLEEEEQVKIDELLNELEEKIDEIQEKYIANDSNIETFAIKPRRSDISVKQLAVVYRAIY